MLPMRSTRTSYLVQVLCTAIAYLAAARLGLLLASINHNASPVWPATGIAMLCLFITGTNKWPAIAIAAFIANHLAGSPTGVNLTIAGGNTLEAIAGAEILRRLVLGRLRVAFQFEALAAVLVATIPPAISATIGNIALAVGGVIPWNAYGGSWLTCWTGDALGALCLVPIGLFISSAGLGWTNVKHQALTAKRLAFLLGCGGAAGLVFFVAGPGPWIFALLPILIGAASWFGPITTNVAMIIISGIGIAATVTGKGPFTGGTLNDNLIFLQLFLASIALTGAMIPELLAHPGRRKLPIFCLLIGWALSGAIFQSFHLDEADKDQRRFQTLIEKTQRNIANRLADYEDALRAGASLYAASDFVSREEWRTFLGELRAGERYPGVKGIGVILPVAADHLKAFEEEQRKSSPDFRTHAPAAFQANDRRSSSDHFVITYIEPLATNAAAVGLDIGTDQVRRQAAEAARDTGLVAATGRIALVQDQNSRPGFMLLFPFYQTQLPSGSTVQQRRSAFRGLVYAPFVFEEFFAGLLETETKEIDVSIFESSSQGPSAIIFSSDSDLRQSTQNHELLTKLPFAQQTLELGWRRASRFSSSHDAIGAWAAFCAVLLGLLLTTAVVAMRDTGLRASSLAEERTHEIIRLEKANRTYTTLVQEIKDYGIVVLSSDGCISTWNDGAQRLTGYAAAAIVGQSAGLLCPEESTDSERPHKALLIEAFNLGRLEIEDWRVRSDGSRFLANVIYTRIDDDRGIFKGYSMVFSDVTAHRERERVQRDALMSLRLATGASKMGFFYVDLETNMSEYSGEFKHLLGIELTGDPQVDHALLISRIPDANRSRIEALMAAYYGGETPDLDFESAFESKPHGTLWIRLSMHTTKSAKDGRPLSIVASVQDLTLQRAAGERVRNSELRLAYALEGSNDGLWDWNIATGEVYVSDKLSRQLALPELTTFGTMTKLESHIHPDDFAKVSASLLAHLGGAAPLHECQLRYLLSDGSWGWFLTRGKVSEWGSSGMALRMTGVHINIAAQKHAEKLMEDSRNEIARQNEQLLVATSARSRFLATMSHEIRTPLNGILGMTDLLSETTLDGDQQGLVRIVQQSGSTLLSLINDILDFSKIDAGKLELEHTSFSLEAVVASQIDLLLPQAKRKDLQLQSVIQPHLHLKRVGDPGRISQVLLNLIGNAVKFTASGSVEVMLSTVGDAASSSMVRFAVKDTGIGVTPGQAAELFQPFKQADSSTSRKFGGSGLGLSICKGLVDAMGGHIGVESAQAGGSTFWFELPLSLATERSQSADALAHLTPPPEAESPTSRSVHILVAEDNPTNQLLVKRLLLGMGYTCDLAANGLEALAAVRSTTYDLILMDCQMPEMDGYEATRRLRIDEAAGPRTPIIAVTANAMAGDKQLCLDAGMDDFITKPIRKVTLDATIKRWLANNQGEAKPMIDAA